MPIGRHSLRSLKSGWDGHGTLPSVLRSQAWHMFQKPLSLKVLAFNAAACLNLGPSASIQHRSEVFYLTNNQCEGGHVSAQTVAPPWNERTEEVLEQEVTSQPTVNKTQ